MTSGKRGNDYLVAVFQHLLLEHGGHDGTAGGQDQFVRLELDALDDDGDVAEGAALQQRAQVFGLFRLLEHDRLFRLVAAGTDVTALRHHNATLLN